MIIMKYFRADALNQLTEGIFIFKPTIIPVALHIHHD